MPNSRKQNRFTFTLYNYDSWTVPLTREPDNTSTELGPAAVRGRNASGPGIPVEPPPHVRYVCFGEETCPTTGRPHLQGYIVYEFPTGIADAWAMDFDGQDGRLFVARGSTAQNITYCSKDGRFTEFGIKPVDDELSGVHHYVQLLEEKAITVERIVLEMPAVYQRFSRTLERAEDIILGRVARDFVPTVYWLYGPTGCGKTREAVRLAGDNPYWYQLRDHGWQDGYGAQGCVIIDDFRGSIQYEELLRMLDRYPYTFSRRGRRPVPVMATTFIITSSLSPSECYPRRAARDRIEQLERRITEIRYINGGIRGESGELGLATVMEGFLEEENLVGAAPHDNLLRSVSGWVAD